MSANVRLDVGQSIPAGYIVGRLSGGVGPAQLIPIQQLAGQVANSGLVTPSGASGTTNRINRQVITATGTYHKTAGTTQVRIILLGGGGAGGGAALTSSTQQSEGAGGGAGGLTDIFASVTAYDGGTVTIGAGGTGGTGAGGSGGSTTFAGLTAGGGTGGGAGVLTNTGVAGGAGGTASGGDINLTGRKGWFSSIALNGGDTLSGAGAEAPYGLGTPGAMVQTSTTAAGSAATGYGAGGSGAANGASQAAATGGNGAPGICIIDEYGPASGGGGGGGSGTVTSLSQGAGITLSTDPITTTGTITNAGVTSNVAGTGISVSGATGAVTIGNTGVTSLIAGTGISVSGATGAVTIGNTGVTSLTGGNNIKVSASAGAITLGVTGDPSADLDVVPLRTIESLTHKQIVFGATTAALPSCTYSNGTAGVGATLTATANGALAVDGLSLSLVGQSLLVKNQASGFQNGIYTLTQAGDASHPFILTRRSDNDDNSDLSALAIAVDVVTIYQGTTNGQSVWMQTLGGTGTNGTIVIGTDSLSYKLIAASGATAAGASGGRNQIYASQRWYPSALFGDGAVSNTGLNVATGIIYFMPILLTGVVAFNALGVQTSNSVGGANIRLALYAATTTGIPDGATLLVDSGDISVTSGGFKSVSLVTTLQPGVYWAAFQGSSASIAVYQRPTSQMAEYFGQRASLPSLNIGAPQAGIEFSQAYGAYPGTAPTTSYGTRFTPEFLFQVQ